MLIGLLDLEKVQAIIERAQHPVAVMSTSERGGHDLEIMAIPITPEIQADIAARGLQCVAITGVLDGAFEIQMPRALSEDAASAIGAAYSSYLKDRVGAQTNA